MAYVQKSVYFTKVVNDQRASVLNVEAGPRWEQALRLWPASGMASASAVWFVSERAL